MPQIKPVQHPDTLQHNTLYEYLVVLQKPVVYILRMNYYLCKTKVKFTKTSMKFIASAKRVIFV